MKNVSISFAEDAVPGYPAMMSYITKECRRAMFACNVEEIDFENVTFEGYEGEKLLLSEVGKFVVDGKETRTRTAIPSSRTAASRANILSETILFGKGDPLCSGKCAVKSRH